MQLLISKQTFKVVHDSQEFSDFSLVSYLTLIFDFQNPAEIKFVAFRLGIKKEINAKQTLSYLSFLKHNTSCQNLLKYRYIYKNHIKFLAHIIHYYS